jgi:hypothetical protein
MAKKYEPEVYLISLLCRVGTGLIQYSGQLHDQACRKKLSPYSYSDLREHVAALLAGIKVFEESKPEFIASVDAWDRRFKAKLPSTPTALGLDL